MGKDIRKFTVKELKLIARVSGMIGYSNLRKAELILKLEEHLYFHLYKRCHSCGYNVTDSWIDWAFYYYDIYKPFSYSLDRLFNCPNCGIEYFNYN